MLVRDKKTGVCSICCDDWTPSMLRLSVKLHQLPSCPPAKLQYANPHDFGIERLALMDYGRVASGHVAIEMLLDHVTELECQPTSFELVAMGLTLVRMPAELEMVRRRMQTAARIKAAKEANRRLGEIGRKKEVMRRGN